VNDPLDRYRRVEMTPIDVELDLLDFRTFSRQGTDPFRQTSRKEKERRNPRHCLHLDCGFFQPCPVHSAVA
jgi:hypothetical protein